jgi:hypothetical protein
VIFGQAFAADYIGEAVIAGFGGNTYAFFGLH